MRYIIHARVGKVLVYIAYGRGKRIAGYDTRHEELIQQ